MPRKRKPKAAHAIIEVPLYGSIITLFRERPKLSGAVALSFRSEVAPNSYGVVLPPGASPGIVAHEALHIANWIAEDLDLRPTTENDEPHAYLLQFLTEAFSEALLAPAARA